MKKAIGLILFLLPLFCFADDSAFVQNCINSGCTLPTSTYTVTSLTLTHSFNMQGSTINFTGTGVSFNMNVAGTTLSNGTLIGSTSVYNPAGQYGINMGATNQTVNQVNISNFPAYGVVMGKFSNQTFTNNTVSNTGYIGISCVNATGSVTGINISSNTINRGAQGVGVQQPAIIFRGQTGGTISNSTVNSNTIAMPANPTSSAAEGIEFRSVSLTTFNNNSISGSSIGLSIVQGCVRITATNNTFTNTKLEAIEIGDSPSCKVSNSTITNGKIGILLDGSTANPQDTIQSAAITGLTSYPVQVNTSVAVALNDVLNNISGTTVTNALDVIRATGITLNNWSFSGNNTTYPIFIDTSTGGITVNSSSFTGFTPRLFFFYKASSPSITVNNVIANLTTISPGIVCYATSANIILGSNVSCNLAPAVPIVNYSPNNFTYYVNVPITPVSINSTGGAVSGYTISPTQPSGIVFNSANAQFSGVPLAITPKTNMVVTANNISGSDTAQISMTIVDRPPVLNYSPSTQVCTINVPITNMIPNLGGGGAPTGFTVTPALPANIVLNPTTGVISGTGLSLLSPTVFTINCFNSGGSVSFPVTLSIVNPAVVAPNISYLPNTYSFPINVGITTIHPINIGGAATSWAISPPLSTGLSFSTVDGSVSGLPTALLSSTPFDISSTNVTGTSHTTLNLAVINVLPAPPSLSFNPTSVTLTQNQTSVLISPTNTGGVASSYSISPTLVSGLAFNSVNGEISGVPTVTSPAILYTVTGHNAGGDGSAGITIQVVSPSPGAPSIRVAGHFAIIE